MSRLRRLVRVMGQSRIRLPRRSGPSDIRAGFRIALGSRVFRVVKVERDDGKTTFELASLDSGPDVTLVAQGDDEWSVVESGRRSPVPAALLVVYPVR